MKSRHLTLDQIAALLDGRLTGSEKSDAQAHLEGGCARCAAEADQLREAIGALRRYELTSVPEVLTERALDAIRAARDAAGLGTRVGAALAKVAELVFDSWKAPAPAGVRGGVAPVRQLVYQLDEDRFTLRVQRESEEMPYEIAGRVFLIAGGAGGVSVTLRSDRGRGRRSKTEASGDFLFESVRPGRYSVQVALRQGDVTLGGIELP